MATQKTRELIAKNREDIAQQEQNILQAQAKLKKLKARRKELLEKEKLENQKEMLEQLNTLEISDPTKLQEILNLYLQEYKDNQQKDENQQVSEANYNSENQGN